MKYLFLLLILLYASFGSSQTATVPEVLVRNEVIGGDILLIQMKEYLIITGQESQMLEKELSADGKKNFTKDIVTEKPMAELVLSYNPQNNKPTTQLILLRYADLLRKINLKTSLN